VLLDKGFAEGFIMAAMGKEDKEHESERRKEMRLVAITR